MFFKNLNIIRIIYFRIFILFVFFFFSCKNDKESASSKNPQPIISSIHPSEGNVGTLVTITGNNFSSNASEITITFNKTKASEISFSSKSQISTKVPLGASTGKLSVTVAGQSVEGPIFRIIDTSNPVSEPTPKNFKIAFFGDSGIDPNADAVLSLVKNENANAVVHVGDLGYDNVTPRQFEDNINSILGASFPYFYSVGNHDDHLWNINNGYKEFLEARFRRLGIRWSGKLGILSSFSYKGIFFVATAPDEFDITPQKAGNYIRETLKKSNAKWKVSFWHKNQKLMQIGSKKDEAGWDVYEESRRGGAIVATGHEHSYSRTHEMSNFRKQIISNKKDTVKLVKDNLSTNSIDEGRSFAFVSGLGGKSIRSSKKELAKNPWWANVYHKNNGGQHGVLFGVFNYKGDATLAQFYFKDIDGTVRDVFFVRSHN